ncbi:hypothetical protein [Lutispora saccharofermentans]|uniref:hypothetical protein n=1 Tax=Lutispora saccharofermentans TaxID=3024236 RepID=UPI002FDDBCCA
MYYITTSEAAEKWGVSGRSINYHLAAGHIPDAVKKGKLWLIPADAQRPADNRRHEGTTQKSLSSDLHNILVSTTIPMPHDNPEAILDTVSEERLRLQYEGELAYLRGDFKRTMRCFDRTEGDDAARLRASLMAVAAAISLGDYRAYTEIDSYLKRCIEANQGSDMAAIAELALASVAVSVTAPNMVPDWLKEGDFSAIPIMAKPHTLYLRSKYFFCVDRYEAMLAVAQTALTLSAPEQGITFTGIYLRVVCAIACHHLEREDAAVRWLLEAMRICLPHGFITPFAEVATLLGGLVERCLEREFPDYYDAVIGQWKRTFKNWIAFHNEFTKDHITFILSLRECHIAILVAHRVPYAKIAKQYNISVGRLKNIMLEIYEKLCISGRNELAKYIM